MFKEILRHGVEPFFATRRWGRAVKGRAAELCCDIDNFCGQRKREELHFRSPQWQAMIRGCPGNARRRLDHIEPVHRVVRAIWFAPPRKLSRVKDVSRAA